MQVDLRALGIRTVLSVGEPGGAVEATWQRLTDGWGAFVNDGYGLTELFPLGGGCRYSRSLHIASDLVITEIVEPDTGRPLPPEEPGEVVYTNLVSDTQPLLRFRSRDIARMAVQEPCQCGFSGVRLRDSIEGRVDDMIWVRGVNVFPSAIEGVVRGFEHLTSEYRIVVGGSDASPTLTVRVEVVDDLDQAHPDELEKTLEVALRSTIRVRAAVTFLPSGTLPRADGRGKLARVLDQRTR